jgi:uncharacterized protein YraI
MNQVSGDAEINISWYSGNHGDGSPFDGPGNILGHAYFPLPYLGSLAGDVHLDDDETWVVGQPAHPWEIHLKTVATHEIGHALGLDHTDDPSALMYAIYDGPRGIAPDDIAGIQSLYGPPDANDAPAPPPPSGGDGLTPSGVNATATTTLKMRSSPSTSGAQVGKIPYNTKVPIYAKNAAGDWLYVDYNGVRGWVAAWYCKLDGSLNTVPVISQTPAAPTPSGPAPAPSSVTATTTSNVRMRAGPGTDYAQVGTVDWGATVPVYAKNPAGDWLYIGFNGTQGWILARLVKITGDTSTLPVQSQ